MKTEKTSVVPLMEVKLPEVIGCNFLIERCQFIKKAFSEHVLAARVL
jgi:hypothetical protein